MTFPIRHNIKHYLVQALLSLTLLISVSLANAADDHLTLTGSSTVAPLALEIAKRFEAQHPDVRIDVQMGGSTRGVHDARTGLTDIGMVSRTLKSTEQDLTAYLIAMDGIGIILHKSNPVKKLSQEKIIAIYTGKIRNWREVGGQEQAITVVNKATGHSTLELFLAYFSLKNRDITADVIIGSNQQGLKTVAGNPGAIGYVSIGAAEYEESQGTPIKLLPMADQVGTTKTVAKGIYPLSRPLNLVVKGAPTGLAHAFITFAQSDAVKDLIESQFFVPPSKELVTVNN